MDRKLTLTLTGAALVIFGIVMFFKSVRVVSVGFYRPWSGVSTGGILIVLLLLDLIIFIATENRIAKILLPILVALLVLMLILGTHFVFVGSLLDLLLMLVPPAVGAGLLLRVFLTKNDS